MSKKQTPPKLPSKKTWDTYRRWKQYPTTPADVTLDVRRIQKQHKDRGRT